MNSQISIIIPAYNCSKHIEQCIFSVLKQSFQSFEIILIDDGSTDSTYELCNRISEKEPRLHVFKQINHGVSYTRNKGISLAKSKYVMFMDADDYLEADLLLELYESATVNNADLTIGGLKFIYASGKQIIYQLDDCSFETTNINNHYSFLEKQLAFNAPVAKLFNKEILIKNNLAFNEKISILEDQSFVSVFLSYSGIVSTISYVGYAYRRDNDGSLVKRFNANGAYAIDFKIQSERWLYKTLSAENKEIMAKKQMRLVYDFVIRLFLEKDIELKKRKQLYKTYKQSKEIRTIMHLKKKERKIFLFSILFRLPFALSFLCFSVVCSKAK